MPVGGRGDHTHPITVLCTVIDGTDILYRDYVDISVAVATPKVRVNFDLWFDATSDPMTFDPRGW